MFYGIIESESLNNPTILNSFKTKKVVVESVPLSENPYWHIFIVEVDDNSIEKLAYDLSLVVKPSWYQIFWNDEWVYVVLQSKVFELRREKAWSSPEYEEMRKYALGRGIDEEYLDFNQNFAEYEKIIQSIR